MSDVNPTPYAPDVNNDPKLLLNQQKYELLKKLVQQVLPALGALYAGLAVLWGFPNGEEVVGSLALIATFGGVVLGISAARYNNSEARFDGQIDVETNHDEGYSNLHVQLDPVAVADKDEVTVKVNRA